MPIRPHAALLPAALVLASLVLPLNAAATTSPPDAPRDLDDLERLRADSSVAVRVERDSDRDIALVGSPSGRPLVGPATAATAGPEGAARAYLARYGGLMQLDGTGSVAGDVEALPSATGGHIVRATQRVGGLPVLGGDVVVSLDPAGRLLSLAGETTQPTTVPPAVVPESRARRTAVEVSAAAHRLPARRLAAAPAGRWLYDPELIGEQDPAGVRPVWRFDVTGPGVRDLVLVDTGRGGVALRVQQLAGLTRRVCDRRNQAHSTSVPQCTTVLAARAETTGETGETDVDAAFANVGRAAALYASLGRDLGETIGVGAAGSKVIESWVRWCNYGETCPMANAFWNGARMVLGDGYAGADDVVAHELTHGVIDRTSKLVYLHQSGAINESLADVMGELVDQRHHDPDEDDSAWLLGEDSPGGAVRSLQDPTLFGQPDRMTSPAYGGGDSSQDNGEVHRNSGVGNKAAYLISQGGHFNGVTVAGIDAGDAGRTKTATLYHQVMTRLTSGAEYDDVGRTLVATCRELAAASAGFETGDCVSVQAAVDATELMRLPATTGAAAAEVSDACPTGQVKATLFQDDDGVDNSWNRIGQGYDIKGNKTWLWTGTPESFGAPRYVNSGAWSWFGVNPDPHYYGDPSTLTLWPTDGIRVPSQGDTYLHFHHAHVLEWYPATDAAPALYPDGATVQMYTPTDYGWGYNPTPLTWVNGPDKQIRVSSVANPWPGFGGDSHGWGSSRVELTPLAGTSVRPQWKIVASRSIAFLGWYLDDIEIYNCRSSVPTAARSVTATGTATGAKLSWTQPEWPGSGIAGYRVTRSDGLVKNYAATARAATFATLPAGSTTTFTVAPINTGGITGPPVTRKVVRTKLTATASRTQVPKTSDVRLTTTLIRTDVQRPVAGQTVAFQRRPAGSTTWTSVATRTTRSDGTASARIIIPRTSYLRVIYRGGTGRVGSTGPQIKITAY